MSLYHEGSRQLQDECDTRRLADRIEEKLSRTAFSADDRAFIETRAFFFIATADASGWPECSYKGGLPGFVRVVDERTLAFPSYDGNGMFRSLGNLLVNPQLALLFIDFEAPRRLRVLGTATVSANDPLRSTFAGAQHVVRVRAERIFPNCPRYIHRMQMVELSAFVPRPEATPPVPAWKRFDMFSDVLPRGDPANTSEPPADP
jgi:predicted pyridoxine 5'-phosphate oxidase superfamily flavin-nucleotide-binding protein